MTSYVHSDWFLWLATVASSCALRSTMANIASTLYVREDIAPTMGTLLYYYYQGAYCCHYWYYFSTTRQPIVLA